MSADPAATTRKLRVFLSRTTSGLAELADEIAAILRERGAEPVVQSGFLPDWRSVPQMLQDQLHSCDSVIALRPALNLLVSKSLK